MIRYDHRLKESYKRKHFSNFIAPLSPTISKNMFAYQDPPKKVLQTNFKSDFLEKVLQHSIVNLIDNHKYF